MKRSPQPSTTRSSTNQYHIWSLMTASASQAKGRLHQPYRLDHSDSEMCVCDHTGQMKSRYMSGHTTSWL